MKKDNVKHFKLTLEIAARGEYCDVSCPFLSPRSDCRLFGYLRFEGKNHIRHYHCRQFAKGQDDEVTQKDI
jgi:hypothetical protein